MTAASRKSPADRFLTALCQSGAFAVRIDDEPRVTIAARSKGVSLAGLSAPAATADALASAGLALWQGARLVATDAGRARAARLQAGDDVPPFLAQHVPVIREAVDPGAAPVAVDAAESPLAWLARRKDGAGRPLIDATCLAAGERLRRDIGQAQMLPRVTSNWSGNAGSSASGAVHFSESAAAARLRVDKALAAAGEDMAGLLLDVCGFLKGLELVESERGWPQRSARVVLALALGRLAKHYGLAREASGPRRSQGVRQWGAPDYRPAIGAA